MEADYLKIANTLLNGTRYGAGEAVPDDGIGIYAYFIRDHDKLDVPLGECGLLYIGMTQSSLLERNHFYHPNSSFSSPRRSLGAVLREELKLRVIPRGSGKTLKDIQNYRFDEAGEVSLSQWMERNLTYSYAIVGAGIAGVEKALIGYLAPPLNLTISKNLSVHKVKMARGACRDIARSHNVTSEL